MTAGRANRAHATAAPESTSSVPTGTLKRLERAGLLAAVGDPPSRGQDHGDWRLTAAGIAEALSFLSRMAPDRMFPAAYGDLEPDERPDDPSGDASVRPRPPSS